MSQDKIDWNGKLEIVTQDGVFDVIGGVPPLIDGERMVFWKKNGCRTYQHVNAESGRFVGVGTYQVRNKALVLPEGVTLWSSSPRTGSSKTGGAFIKVDGIPAGYIFGNSEIRAASEAGYPYPREYFAHLDMDKLAKHRDEVRAKRLAAQKFIRLPDGNNLVVGDLANLRNGGYIAVVKEFRADGKVDVEWFRKTDGTSIGTGNGYNKDGTHIRYSSDDLVSKCVASDIPAGFPLDKIGDAVLRKQVEELRKPKIDPHRPVEGVELKSAAYKQNSAYSGADLYIDGKYAGYLNCVGKLQCRDTFPADTNPLPRTALCPAHTVELLTKIRDEVRASRPDAEGHVSTPFEPVRGVKLYRYREPINGDGHVTAVFVDDVQETLLDHTMSRPCLYCGRDSDAATFSVPNGIKHSTETIEALRAFRDNVRADRQPRELSSETFPTGNVYVRHNSWKKGARALVSDVGEFGIKYADGSEGVLSYRSLRVGYDLSVDGGVTWRPATANAWKSGMIEVKPAA